MKLSGLLLALNINAKMLFDHEIAGIKTSHQEVKNGDIFVALIGQIYDAHNFIEGAIRNGAKTIFVSKYVQHYEGINIIHVYDTHKSLSYITNYFYGFPSQRLNIVGVTGTNGKTTITHMINHIYNHFNEQSVLIGTLGIYQKSCVSSQRNTTPDNLTLQKIFSEAIEENVEHVVMEVSSHAIKQQRISQIDFDTIIFTNLSHDHLDYHPTFEDYQYTKGLLISGLGNQVGGIKKVILNRDDKHFPFYYRIANVDVLTYGIENKADVRAKNIVTTLSGTTFEVIFEHKSVKVDIPIIGDFNVYNTLACITYFLSKGYELEQICNGLKGFKTVDGRMELIKTKNNSKIIIDYAHTPDGVEKVLTTLKSFFPGKITTVIGCGGDRDREKRSLIGEIVSQNSDRAIFTTDNPRNENPLMIINDILKGVKSKNFIVIADRKNAIELAVNLQTEDEILLILGKGHEVYQDVNGVSIPFNDKVTVLDLIES